MNQWQPIDTAPKDQTQKERLLGFDPNYGIRFIRYDGWANSSGQFEIVFDGVFIGEGGSYEHYYSPTHWMPLPPLPASMAVKS
jgi:hypothetical protein